MTQSPAHPLTAPSYLFEVPVKVLRGDARDIEAWCRDRGKQPPTLMHLSLAREARSAE